MLSLNAMILPKSVSNFATNFVTDYNPVKKNLLQRNQRTVDCSELKQ